MLNARLFFVRSVYRTWQALFGLLLVAWMSTQALAQYGTFALSQGTLKSTETGVLSFATIYNPPCPASQLELLVNGNAVGTIDNMFPSNCNGNINFGFNPGLVNVGDQISIRATCSNVTTAPTTVVGNAFVLTSKLYANSLNIFAVGRKEGSGCPSSAIQLRINGVAQPAGTMTVFKDNFGLFQASIPFGILKPGDVVTLYEPCTGNSTLNSVVVEDINAYVEVTGDASNGIGPTESGSAYDRLNTPVSIYTCNTLNVTGHAGFTAGFNASENEQQIGVFRLNGNTVTPGQFAIYYNKPNADVTPDLTSTYTRTRYYFQAYLNQQLYTPTTWSYTHNGVTACNDITLTLGPIALTQISTTGGVTNYGFYTDGDYNSKQFRTTSNPNAVFELSYDGNCISST